jgi:hypothetical protein
LYRPFKKNAHKSTDDFELTYLRENMYLSTDCNLILRVSVLNLPYFIVIILLYDKICSIFFIESSLYHSVMATFL